MIGFSQTLGYAVQALACLDHQQARSIDEIARGLTVPKPYLRKVVKRLSEEGLIVTRRGRRGGVLLSRSAESITLLQVVKAVEGSNWITPCLLSMDTCTALRFCPLKDFWTDIKRTIEKQLRNASLNEVVGNKSILDRPKRPPKS